MDTVSDIERTQRKERSQIREDALAFEDLQRHKGWARYIALLETLGQNYHSSIMKPLDNALEVTRLEFAKGVLSGLSLATAIPRMKISEALELRRADDEEE